eukprot:TRINITY_DN4151_c0_g1_i1.p1 TRINITY_DN4151_c0_g1~~TRINITY_DN4151_c0_g1_i1.p1  ORF type:complete len:258 (+),score=17.89 TRINITY_DN4151_c0_g1_i1:470-1243(+)
MSQFTNQALGGMKELHKYLHQWDVEVNKYKDNSEEAIPVSKEAILQKLTGNYQLFKCSSPIVKSTNHSPQRSIGELPAVQFTASSRKLTPRQIFSVNSLNNSRITPILDMKEEGIRERVKEIEDRILALDHENQAREHTWRVRPNPHQSETRRNDELIHLEKMRKVLIKEISSPRENNPLPILQRVLDVKNKMIPREQEQQQILEEEKQKKKIDMMSRKPFSSAYYQLMAMDPVTRTKVKKRLTDVLSDHSRLKNLA